MSEMSIWEQQRRTERGTQRWWEIRWDGFGEERFWAIVSSSLCLPRQRGGNKWLECHLQKQFNYSFVYGAGQKGLLWRAGHRWSSEWKRYKHTPTLVHPHTKTTCAGDWLITWVHTICHGGWHPALGAHAEKCSHTQMLVHVRKSFLFYNCCTFPQQRSFCAY